MNPADFFVFIGVSNLAFLIVGLGLAFWKRHLKIALAWGSIGLLFSAVFFGIWAAVIDPDLQHLFISTGPATDTISLAPLAWLLVSALVAALAVYRCRGKAQSVSFLVTSVASAPFCLLATFVIVAIGSTPAVRY